LAAFRILEPGDLSRLAGHRHHEIRPAVPVQVAHVQGRLRIPGADVAPQPSPGEDVTSRVPQPPSRDDDVEEAVPVEIGERQPAGANPGIDVAPSPGGWAVLPEDRHHGAAAAPQDDVGPSIPVEIADRHVSRLQVAGGADRMSLPRAIRRLGVLEPDGAQGDVQVAVAIQVSCGQPTLRAVPLGDHGLGPIRRGVPDQGLVLAGDDHVRPAIAVDID
jgi:hypothetical protein